MRIPNVVFVLALFVGLAPVAPVAAQAQRAGDAAGKLHPNSLRDPNAASAAAEGPGYGLFSCQVGRSVGQCYDPYQMRHAYNIDGLVNSGFDGRGKTIVIID